MVLEALIGPVGAKRHPLRLFFFGLLLASLSVIFSIWVFKSQSSLVMVFLAVISAVPLMVATIKREEKEDILDSQEVTMLKSHEKTMVFLTCLFFGFIVGYSLWYVFLPSDTVNTLFSTQLDTIESINANVAKYLSGDTIDWGLGLSTFLSILSNNVKVLIFCIFFAFFFGAGAIFILTWNASVIATAMGTFIRNGLESYAHLIGWSRVAIYFHLFSLSLVRFMLHGTFEIVAYFIGGLAGGIISVALIKQGFDTSGFKKVLVDASLLTLIALALLFVGSFIEVFITPLLF